MMCVQQLQQQFYGPVIHNNPGEKQSDTLTPLSSRSSTVPLISRLHIPQTNTSSFLNFKLFMSYSSTSFHVLFNECTRPQKQLSTPHGRVPISQSSGDSTEYRLIKENWCLQWFDIVVICLCDCQSLSLAHVLTPCILMFVLALVHTQIMVSYCMSKKSRQLVNNARYFIVHLNSEQFDVWLIYRLF